MVYLRRCVSDSPRITSTYYFVFFYLRPFRLLPIPFFLVYVRGTPSRLQCNNKVNFTKCVTYDLVLFGGRIATYVVKHVTRYYYVIDTGFVVKVMVNIRIRFFGPRVIPRDTQLVSI